MGLQSSTIFSLGGELPVSRPARSGGGQLDAGTLVTGDARHPCLVHRLSAAGATLRLGIPADEGAPYALELANGQSIAGHISWRDEADAGFLFDAPVDVVGTLARNLANLPAERRSVPRVELRQTVSLRAGNEVAFARTRDVSQAGVGVEGNFTLEPETQIQIAFDGLRPIDGVVRWAREGQAGIAFKVELAWQVLMPWLRQVQNRPTRILAPRAHAHHDDERGFGLAADKAAIRIDAPGRIREGVRWWNVRVRNLTPMLVEFEADAVLERGAQLWLSLPGSSGWPVTLLEADHHRYLAEFRLPLRQHELAALTPGRTLA